MQLVDTLETGTDDYGVGTYLSPTDKFNINYLRDDSWEWASPQPVRALFPPVAVAFGRSTDSTATQPVILRYDEPGDSHRMTTLCKETLASICQKVCAYLQDGDDIPNHCEYLMQLAQWLYEVSSLCLHT